MGRWRNLQIHLAIAVTFAVAAFVILVVWSLIGKPL